jgi:hypothetical protein
VNLTLERTSRTPECTQGVLELPGGFTLYTLERTWAPDASFPGGEPDVSCVPAGVYELALHDTPKHPQCFALVNPALGVIHEPDPAYPNARVACLLHVANYPSQLEGCIGVGMSAEPCVISQSTLALSQLKANVPWVAGHTLMITEDQLT